MSYQPPDQPGAPNAQGHPPQGGQTYPPTQPGGHPQGQAYPPTQPGAYPPPGPGYAGAPPGGYGAPPPPAPQPAGGGRSPGVIVAVIAVVALVIGGGIFAVVALTGGDTAAGGDPVAAVQAFADALESGDEARIVETLAARERSVISNNLEPLRTILRNLPESQYRSRLGDVLEVDVQELVLREVRSDGDMTFVAVDKLRLTATAKLERIETAQLSVDGTTVTVVENEGDTETESLTAPIEVVVLRESGGAKVSLLYSSIHNGLVQGGTGQALALAPPGGSPAATPEAAVQALADAIESKDVAVVADALDPYEGRPIKGTLVPFLNRGTDNPEIDQALQLVQAVGLSFDVTLRSEPLDGDRAIVFVSGTLTASFFGESQEVDLDELSRQLQGQGLPGFFVVCVRDGGGWRVSLLETGARYGVLAGEVFFG